MIYISGFTLFKVNTFDWVDTIRRISLLFDYPLSTGGG